MHHSKNGVNPIFKGTPSFENSVDTDTAFLNVDKKNKIIRTNDKNKENQVNHFTNI